MTFVALKLFLLCLLHLGIQGQLTVNTNVLSQMIQYFDEKLQPYRGDWPTEYAVLIRVPLTQCTHDFSIDSDFTNDVRNAFNEFRTNPRNRFYQVPGGILTAAKPTYESSSSEENYHAEFILIYDILPTIMEMDNDRSCVLLYTYYSPCIEKCINDEYNNILQGLLAWNNRQTTGIRALVFQEIWPNDSTGVPQDQEEQFVKINDLVPLYRCHWEDDNQMRCDKCGDADSETLDPNCVAFY